MNTKTGFSLLVTAFIVVLFTACKSGKEDKEPPEPTTQLIQRGEYLVTVMGCHDCHSPKVVGPQGATLIQDILLSGYHADMTPSLPDTGCLAPGWALMSMDLTVAAGPWGVSYAANLTPHQTGIGNWTIENFKRALTEGKFKGLVNGRTLLPPMPWPNFVNMKNEDIEAIFAYLQNLPPVNNAVPPPILPSVSPTL